MGDSREENTESSAPCLEVEREIVKNEKVESAPQGQTKGEKIFKTVALCSAYFALGLVISIPGPTLLDLQQQTNSNTEDISYIFSGRSFGGLVGSVLGGLMFDHLNQQILISSVLFLTAVTTLAAPWFKLVVLLAVCVTFQGVAMTILDTGGNIYCLRLWGKESGPYMQSLHFAFSVGAFVAPLMAPPFLSHTVNVPSNASLYAITNNMSFSNDQSVQSIVVNDSSVVNDGFISNLPLPCVKDGYYIKNVSVKSSELEMKINTAFEKIHLLVKKLDEKFSKSAFQNNATVQDIKTEIDALFEVLPENVVNGEIADNQTSSNQAYASSFQSQLQFMLNGNSSSSRILQDTEKAMCDWFIYLTNAVSNISRNNTMMTHYEITTPTYVQYVYLIIAIILALNSFTFLGIYLYDRHIHLKQNRGQTSDPPPRKEDLKFKIIVLVILFFFYLFYVGLETSYGSFVTVFANEKLHWHKEDAVLLPSVFWGAMSLGRGLAIIVAKFLSSFWMLVIDLALCTVSLLVMIIAADKHEIVMWVASCTFGLGMASVFPSGLSWVDQYIQTTGKAVALVIVGSSLGEFVLPPILGYVHEEEEGYYFLYILFGVSLGCCLFFACVAILARRHGKLPPLNQNKEEMVEMNTSKAPHPSNEGDIEL